MSVESVVDGVLGPGAGIAVGAAVLRFGQWVANRRQRELLVVAAGVANSSAAINALDKALAALESRSAQLIGALETIDSLRQDIRAAQSEVQATRGEAMAAHDQARRAKDSTDECEASRRVEAAAAATERLRLEERLMILEHQANMPGKAG